MTLAEEAGSGQKILVHPSHPGLSHLQGQYFRIGESHQRSVLHRDLHLPRNNQALSLDSLCYWSEQCKVVAIDMT